jgi:histidyl-tRNA synthetase
VQKPSIPKGTRDFGPEVTAKRKYIIHTIEEVFKLYSFNPLETPTMENLSVLTGKYGDEGDQLLFKVLNSGDFLKKSETSDFESGSKALLPKISEKGLRYDLTVPFARYVVMNQSNITFPFKRYQIQPVWRADRPQKGRYREFYQCDADIVGTQADFHEGWKEIELTLLIKDVFKRLNLSEYEIKVNHRDVLFGIAAYVGMNGKEIPFCVSLDKIDKIGKESVLSEVVAQGGDAKKLGKVLEVISTHRSIPDLLKDLSELIKTSAKGFQELSTYFNNLPDHHKLSLDFSLARGLSYYTGFIFEVKPTSVKMGSISGGGRYDNLTGVFGLSGVSGIGISFGLDRIYDVMEELSLFPSTSTVNTQILITHFSSENMKHGMRLIQVLRENGIPSELYPEQAKIKKQFQFADRNRIPFVVVIGDEEMANERYTFKSLESGEQEQLSIAEIINKIK